MKRTVLCVVMCVLLILSLPTRAAALQDLQYVVDQADLLTDEENNELNMLASALSEETQVDVLIALVETIDGETAEEYAVSLNGSRRWWDTDDAILFLIAVEEREWYISTFGKAITVFTDYGMDRLGTAAATYFSDGRWYDGFEFYMKDMLPTYFEAAQNGTPIDVYQPETGLGYYDPIQEKSLWSVLPISLMIGVAVAGVSLFAMRFSMNTKRRQHSAGDYLKSGSYQLRTHQDIFLYSNLSKTRRQQNTGGPGGHHGGSSIHRSSGGRSHGGRGGKF